MYTREEDERRSKWRKTKEYHTEEETRFILSKVIETSICTVMRNHAFQFRNKFYL